MVETLITSSALIAGICAFRLLFKGRISPRIMYAMWGLPALRLLMPLFYPADRWLKTLRSSFSVMNAVDRLHEQVIAGTEMEPLVDNILTGRVRGYANPDTLPQKLVGVDWQLVFLAVWLTGSAVLLVWILWVNFHFAARLRRTRVRCRGAVYGVTHLPVYRVLDLRSPCLVMFLGEQSIYLPEDLEAEPEQIEHILIHETCHARHLDPVWGALRCMLVCAYWINPLVFLAAYLSKRDCELACDEAAVKRLGEGSRFDYGRTLIALTAGKRAFSDLFCISADFVFGRKTMKERITLLAAWPRTTALTAALVLAVSAALIACTYTGRPAQGLQKRTELWAEYFCSRDGRALAGLYSQEHQDGFYGMEPVNTDESGNYLGFGWSSPWPMDGRYDIQAENTRSQITYYAMTSEPHLWVWKETLEWEKSDGIYYVDREALSIFDAVSVLTEFEAAYGQGIEGTPLDYRTNGMGAALNENVKGDPVMAFLAAPETAGPYLLNLEGGRAAAETVGDQSSVTYEFRDGSSVVIRMERPFGADGIWVPTGWSGAVEAADEAEVDEADEENVGVTPAPGEAERTEADLPEAELPETEAENAEAGAENSEAEAVKAVVGEFAQAYFRDDPAAMARVMTGSAAKKIAGAGEQLWDRLDAFQIKGDLSDAENRDQLEVQCEYRVAGEDSFSYLGVELVREETGWSVSGYYLEK
ncbi:M56 family metallopeptidase [Enterocloster asparagiformis]|uniref:M56 family metallopeptidase n=1 Tax=Enterocloster asparagiformis TaxID=333367 RepID=UPI000464EF71|nr:M56 family metallopeptidase [Enterocloster asparagiformis]